VRGATLAVSLAALIVIGGARELCAQPRPAYLPGAAARTAPAAAQYPLRREAGGWVFEHSGFAAHITEDGAVRFDNRHGELHLALPLPLPLPPGTPTLEGTVRGLVNPRARPRPAPPPEQVGPLPHLSPYRPDPTEWCTYPNPCFFVAPVTLVNVAGTFDLTDEILRLRHKDPYRNQKASFLASTAGFRQDLQRRAAARAQQHALEDLRQRLDAIERDPHLGPAERRRAYQDLAAELDVDPAVAGRARALIGERLRAFPPDAGAR
jgi:hypothetical protein